MNFILVLNANFLFLSGPPPNPRNAAGDFGAAVCFSVGGSFWYQINLVQLATDTVNLPGTREDAGADRREDAGAHGSPSLSDPESLVKQLGLGPDSEEKATRHFTSPGKLLVRLPVPRTNQSRVAIRLEVRALESGSVVNGCSHVAHCQAQKEPQDWHRDSESDH